MEQRKTVLSLSNIKKSFPGVKALDDVSMEFERGEVVGLLGENGAGKSTLVKILSGAYTHDDGEIVLDGKLLPKQFSTLEARRFGIAIIYQELSLMNEMTVMENIYISHEPQTFPGVIDYKKMAEQTALQLEKLNAKYISPKSKVGSLPLPQRQIVEIAKAIALDCKVLIMDEPTTSLTMEEASNLFSVINMLKAQGITIIYISHRMNEIFEICDRAVVMRDGRLVGSKYISECTQNDIIDMMTGKLLDLDYSHKKMIESYDGLPVLLELEHISDGGFVDDLMLKVHEGEVLGIGGLIGAMRTELFRMVCGIDKMESGTVKMRGEPVKIDSPGDAIEMGMGYLSEDRKEDGLSLGLSIEENTVHCDFKSVSRFCVVNWKKVRQVAENFIEKMKTKGTPSTRVMNLSGGNQQKVSISKWLHVGCNVLIFDEPTRGIDVAAKSEIHQLIRRFASTPGNAAVVISSEVHELLAVSDRVVVMSRGKIISELKGAEIEQGNLIKHITTKSGW